MEGEHRAGSAISGGTERLAHFDETAALLFLLLRLLRCVCMRNHEVRSAAGLPHTHNNQLNGKTTGRSAAPLSKHHAASSKSSGDLGSRRFLRQQSGTAAAALRGAQAAACLPLSQSVTTAAAVDDDAPAPAAAPNAPPALRGTVKISNKGAAYLPLDMVTVRVCSKETEHLRVIAKCPREDATLGPFASLVCSWEAQLPAGAAAEMYSGVVSTATLAMTGDACDAPCVHPATGGEGEC